MFWFGLFGFDKLYDIDGVVKWFVDVLNWIV